MTNNIWHVVDLRDEFILFSGTNDECLQVQEESYGGLFVLPDSDPHIDKIKRKENKQ